MAEPTHVMALLPSARPIEMVASVKPTLGKIIEYHMRLNETWPNAISTLSSEMQNHQAASSQMKIAEPSATV